MLTFISALIGRPETANVAKIVVIATVWDGDGEVNNI